MYKLLLIPLVLFITACDGYDKAGCLSVVQDAYIDGEVRRLPGRDYRFIVKTKDGSIRFVETMNLSNTDITTDVLLIK